MEQESKEMINLQKQLRDTIDGKVKNYMTEIYVSHNKYIGLKEKNAYQIIEKALQKQEQRKALEDIIKDIMIAVLFSFFDMIDEGIEMPDGKYLLLDIVNRETKDSIISYSAHEEFINLMPDGYQPFEENE